MRTWSWVALMLVMVYVSKANSRDFFKICTYESISNDISAFKTVQRWDSLIVDEAQRLKAVRFWRVVNVVCACGLSLADTKIQGESGQLFRALRSLNIGNRFLLTGTPLNNSVAEIFNLMAL